MRHSREVMAGVGVGLVVFLTALQLGAALPHAGQSPTVRTAQSNAR